MNFSPQLDRITTYKSAEEAMVVRGLHMNEVIDKVNEINIYNLSLEPLIEKVTVGNYEPSVSNDADIARGIHLRELINEINRVIVNDSLPIEPLNPRLIRNNNFRTKADVIPVTKSVLKEVVRRVSTLAPSWSTYWATRLPYFALPATGVSLMVGQEVTIYGDALINVPIGNPLSVTYTCDIGTQVGNNLVINPVAGDIGNHSLRMVFKNGGYTIEDKTIALTVKAVDAGKSLNILMMGDSTIDGHLEVIGDEIDAALTGNIINYLGTQGTTRKHEAYSGKTFNWYLTHVDSPFVKAGVLNIAAYFDDNAISLPDVVYFGVGINDIYHLDVTTIAAIQSDIEDLIDAFLAYDASLRVVIALPTTCTSSAVLWNADNDEITYPQDQYVEDMHNFWKELVDAYANGTYNARVDCSYEAIFLNRDTGYADSLHLTAGGYAAIGRGLALSLNNYLLLYGAEMINQATWNAAGLAYWDKYGTTTRTGDGVGIIIDSDAGSDSRNYLWGLLTIGKTYKITCKNIAIRNGVMYGNFYFSEATWAPMIVTTLGNHSFVGLCGGIDFRFITSACYTKIIDMSVKEVI